MFKERLMSGIVLVILMILALYPGGWITFLAVSAISMIGLFELLRVFSMERTIFAGVVYLATVVYELLVYFQQQHMLVAFIVFYLLVLLAIYVFAFPKYQAGHVMTACFAVLYVVVLLSYVYQIRCLTNGGYMIVLVFLASWGSDSLAYCAGRLFGKHKMAPILSPKKTVEGAIGGLLGAALLGFLYACIVPISLETNATKLVFPIACFCGAIISIIGDLAASAIKRDQNIKDYSHLIPGHGGILDRFDSVMFTAPVIYYVIVWLGGMA
ncbi:MAG: phosphatidate cytidylyltransferase [Lachnospiraceae bacterium]